MACRSLVHGFVVASLAFVASYPGTVEADPIVLASASFEGDLAGALARPGELGSTTVLENVWDDSTSSAGTAAVATFGPRKRFRLSDADDAGHRGICLPLDSTASSGTLTVEAVVAAEQGDADGGICSAVQGDKEEWLGRTAFAADGNFSVHGQSTSTAYFPSTRYRVRMTVHFGQMASVDYLITEANSGMTILESNGHSIADDTVAAAITYRTDDAGQGGFTIDEMKATQ